MTPTAALELPEDNNIAGADAMAEALVVATLCEIVKLRVVLTEIKPVELIPLYATPANVTDPIVKLALFRILIAPTEDSDARVAILFEAFVRVNAPDPLRTSPDALIAFVCETVPVAYKLKLLAVAVSAALIAILLP